MEVSSMMDRLILFVLCWGGILLADSIGNLRQRVFVDNGAELRDSGMGWVLRHYASVPSNCGSRLAPADRLADWPGLGATCLRVESRGELP